MDKTARSAHRVKTSTSRLRDASLGNEVGSRAQQGTVVQRSDRYLRKKAVRASEERISVWKPKCCLWWACM